VTTSVLGKSKQNEQTCLEVHSESQHGMTWEQVETWQPYIRDTTGILTSTRRHPRANLSNFPYRGKSPYPKRELASTGFWFREDRGLILLPPMRRGSERDVIPMCDSISNIAEGRSWGVSVAQSGCAVRSGGDLPGKAQSRVLGCYKLNRTLV
jgi:hypothetical protein